MKKKLNIFIEFLLSFLTYIILPGWLFVVKAQDLEYNVDNVNFESIRIPLFLPFNPEFARSMTVFSWLSFLGGVLTVALLVFWIFLIIRASVQAMQSKGDSTQLVDVSKKFKSIFIGIFLTFLFPVILSVVGVLIGIGTIFSWPKMFSSCAGSPSHTYYFQAYLEEGDIADVICNQH